MEETTVWKGRSSQVLNLKIFLVCGLTAVALLAAVVWIGTQEGKVPAFFTWAALILMLVPLSVALHAWFWLRSREYELTSERFLITHGIFSRQTDTMELYRVKDFTMLQPFFLRLFRLGNLVLQTSDRTTPTFVIEAIRDPKGFSDLVRKHVESCRDRKRVGEVDMNDPTHG
jgi:uncharacterized membrane protein YdbT with pleckstrin-like domain